jgi:hypothetical protein
MAKRSWFFFGAALRNQEPPSTPLRRLSTYVDFPYKFEESLTDKLYVEVFPLPDPGTVDQITHMQLGYKWIKTQTVRIYF